MITQASIEALKGVIDIVDIIGGYVDLRKSGSNFSACCPFHDEKTPSFMVSGSKGLYHCYGCGVGGDAIKFVMDYEKLNFAEAIEKIADLCNFTLEYEKNNLPKKDDSKLLESVARFYQRRLVELPEYKNYLLKRGVSEFSIEKFGLGFCGASFETLKFAEQAGLDKKKLVELGVLGQDNTRTYVRFAQRVMFPIHSPTGKVVGFGGRTIKDNLPKYLNSPQTSQFNKSKLLYGYHLAKEHIYKYEQIIITEGYLDVIMLHQAGFNTAVATLGTALTHDHLPLLNKGNPKVILSYDGDSAGIKSAFRASMMLAKESKAGGVVIFEGGADPADMVFAKKTDELEKLFSNPIPFVPFVFNQIALKYNLSDPLQKEAALKEASEFLHTLSPLLQEEYRSFVADVLKIPLNLIVPSYKGSGKSYPKSTPSLINKPDTNDKLESVIIRYILEDKSLLDFAVEYIDERVFRYRKKEFSALCRGDFDDAGLIGIEIDDALFLKEDGFKEELVMIILKYNEGELKRLGSDDSLNPQEKAFKIRKLKEDILKLRKGELIGI